ncbi:hypothetical protein CVT24_012731 [Panaeolus cyanescens]|uniref:Fe2OG dioxygenase domain-containing protein n=1 Tax=Panaeolus cyanescens TaxID=181874 RepID=A0A409WKX1_9AGAR|nr:hypothetical protein CVT24_012731 [Panaeolus cyanescens]
MEASNPPLADLSSLEPWDVAPETKMIPEDQYIDLEVVDISQINLESLTSTTSTLLSHAEAIDKAMRGLKKTGFIVVKGFGLTSEEISHQFALGKFLNSSVPEEEKKTLHAAINEGSWAGYKTQGYYKRPDGGYDTTEHYDLYPYTALESRLPQIAKQYLPNIRQFIEHNHYHILPRLLAIISLGLGLEHDALWKLHHRGGSYEADHPLSGAPKDNVDWVHTKDHLRYIIYHPVREEDREKKKYLSLPGHTDLGSVTFLYPQTIAGLQILTAEGEWKYVRHYPGQIVVGLGDSMEFITGGLLKAGPHRVKEPPEDQRHIDRPGMFYFVPFLAEVPLSPINHPAIYKKGGKDIFEEYYQHGGKPMLSNEWLVERSKLVGKKRIEGDLDEFGQKKSAMRMALEDISYRYM